MLQPHRKPYLPSGSPVLPVPEGAPIQVLHTLSPMGDRQQPPRTKPVTYLIVRATQRGELTNLLTMTPTPLESLFTWSFVRGAANGIPAAQLLDPFLDTPLEELLTGLRSACLQWSQLPPWFIHVGCARLQALLRRPVGEIAPAAEVETTRTSLRQRRVGKTTLRDYTPANAAGLNRWQHALTAAHTLHRSMQGDPAAFAELWSIHQPAVLGAIRARTWHDEEAQDIAQDTWLQVWQKMGTYDPAIGTFPAFAKYHARIMCRRAYDKQHKPVLVTGAVHAVPPTVQELDDALTWLVLYEQALQATFASPSPPHQLLAFGLCKLLEWKPEAIVARVFDLPLRRLAHQFEVAYLQAVAPPLERLGAVQACLPPLHAMMDHPLQDVCFDAKTRQTYADLLGCIAGETTLRHYYDAARQAAAAKHEQPPTPQAKITQWWHAVTRRVGRELKRRPDGLA